MSQEELMQQITDLMDQDEELGRRITLMTNDRERFDHERLRRIRGVVISGYLRQLEHSLHTNAQSDAEEPVRK